MLTLLADLPGEHGPVLVLVDDAQWLDAATADALLFAARRLAAEGVVMLFAARDDAFTGTGLPELRLARLKREDAELLLAERGLPPAVRTRVMWEAAGNPLALQELGAAGTGTAHGADPLPVADRVLASFRAQIGGLPESTRLMLLIAAAEGRGHMPSILNAAQSMGVGLADLEDAEHVRLVNVTGRSIAFRHPLIRAASYHGAVTARRVAVHRALADTATEPDCRARHRASAALAPDEEVAAEVEDAAERAHRRTAYATAAALYRQAAGPDARAGGTRGPPWRRRVPDPPGGPARRRRGPRRPGGEAHRRAREAGAARPRPRRRRVRARRPARRVPHDGRRRGRGGAGRARRDAADRRRLRVDVR